MRSKALGLAILLALAMQLVIAQTLSTTDAAEASATSPTTTSAPEVIIIKGRYSGPPLWKVSNGEQVLWIFGYPAQVPKDMEWDSRRVEQVLMQSQEYLPFLLVRGARVPLELLSNPQHQSLMQVLPPELNERYEVLKAEYFPGKNNLDLLRPLVAGNSLLSTMYFKGGIVSSGQLLGTIDTLVSRQRRLKKTVIKEGYFSYDHGSRKQAYVDAYNAVSFVDELTCFDSAVTHARTDIELLRRQANAWALGKVQEMNELASQIHIQALCQARLTGATDDSTSTQQQWDAVWQEWLVALNQALSSNMSSFAVVPIHYLLRDDGVLTFLMSKGYKINTPD